MGIKIWAEVISHSYWLSKRLPAQIINVNIPYTIWYNKGPDITYLLLFGQPGCAFQYLQSTWKGNRFLSPTVYGHFVAIYYAYLGDATLAMVEFDYFIPLTTKKHLPLDTKNT